MKFSGVVLAMAIVGCVSGVAFAKDETDGKSGSLAVEKIVCKQLYVYRDADQAAYKAGVASDGSAVAPADVAAMPSMVPDVIEVPLTVDLARKLNQPVPGGAELKPILGNLRLHKTGKVEFNGQDLTMEVSNLCHIKAPSESMVGNGTTSGTYVPNDSVPMTAPMGRASTENVLNPPDVPMPGSVAPSTTEPPKAPQPMYGRH